MEPHFFHLAKDGQTNCGGEEGPRHHEVKMMLAKEFAARDDIKHVEVEYRVGKYVVDFFFRLISGRSISRSSILTHLKPEVH